MEILRVFSLACCVDQKVLIRLFDNRGSRVCLCVFLSKLSVYRSTAFYRIIKLGGTVSRLTELLARAKAENKELGEELEQEFKMLANRRAFGLAFEHHQPETIELWGRS